MEPDEVRRQVNLFAEAGVGGVMIHSRAGLITPYMGDAWFEAVDAAVDQAEQCGIHVWLYDEDKWPSGFSGGEVVAEHPEFRMRALTVRPTTAAPPPDCTPIGEPVDGLRVYAWQSPLGHEHFNGTCYASLLNPQAMRRFLDLAYEPYAERYGSRFGGMMPAIFTDEPAAIFRRRIVHPALPYATNVPEGFEQMFGYDPLPHLTKLFIETEGYSLFRLHYHRVINHLFETSFTQQLGDWCRAHAIAFTGHFEYEQGLFEQQLWGVDIMPNYRHMDIPGIDHLGCQIHERVTAIQCRSVANQYGKPRVMSELYGASSQDLTFEDRKWIAEQQLCLGVNQFIPHLALYTMSGCRKRDFPPTLSPQQPWWPMNRLFDDSLSRLCAMLAQGQYQAEIAVLHPQESIPLHWTPRIDETQFDGLLEYDDEPLQPDRAAQIEGINQDFKTLTDTLLGLQRTFDYVHEKLFEEDGHIEQTSDGPRLVMGQASYPLVVMPSMTTIRPHTLERLLEFTAAGGTVIQTGQFPALVDAIPDERLHALKRVVQTVAGCDDLPSVLATALPAAVEVDGHPEHLWIHRRHVGTQRMLFLVNLSRRAAAEVNLRWRDIGGLHVERLDPADGSRHPQWVEPCDGDGLMVFTLAPGESRLFTAAPAAVSTDALASPHPTVHPRTEPESLSPTHIERLDDNALLLDQAYYRLGEQPWSERPVPVIAIQEYLDGRHYDGPLSLRFMIESELTSRRKVHLIAEKPATWQITLNEQPVSYEGLPFWRDIRWLPIDVSGGMQRGTNVIECHTDRFQAGDLCCFDDPAARYGTEVEPLILIGDFGVAGAPGGERPACPLWEQYDLPPPQSHCLAGPFMLVDPHPLVLGDVICQGLPFYAGRLRYDYRSGLSARAATLRLDGLEACVADVSSQGQSLGGISAAPYTLRLKGGAEEHTEFSVTLFNSLRNLLGPHHHPQGLMPVDYPGAYTADPYRVRRPDGSEKAWIFTMERGETHPDWNPHYAFRQYGLINPVWLEVDTIA